MVNLPRGTSSFSRPRELGVRVVYCHFRPVSVLYARAMGPYATSSQAAWATLTSWLDKHGARRLMKRGYGFMRDNPQTTSPDLLRYDACIGLVGDLDADPEAGIHRQILPGGSYAVHTHVGSYDDLGEKLSKMSGTVVPRRGLTVDHDRAFMAIFLNDPGFTREVHRRVELCVPVQPIRMPFSGNDDQEGDLYGDQNSIKAIVG